MNQLIFLRQHARLAQSVERTTLNRVAGGSSPPSGAHVLLPSLFSCLVVGYTSELFLTPLGIVTIIITAPQHRLTVFFNEEIARKYVLVASIN